MCCFRCISEAVLMQPSPHTSGGACGKGCREGVPHTSRRALHLMQKAAGPPISRGPVAECAAFEVGIQSSLTTTMTRATTATTSSMKVHELFTHSIIFVNWVWPSYPPPARPNLSHKPERGIPKFWKACFHPSKPRPRTKI